MPRQLSGLRPVTYKQAAIRQTASTLTPRVSTPEEMLQNLSGLSAMGSLGSYGGALFSGVGGNVTAQRFVQDIRQRQAASGFYQSNVGTSTETTGLAGFRSFLQAGFAPTLLQSQLFSRQSRLSPTSLQSRALSMLAPDDSSVPEMPRAFNPRESIIRGILSGAGPTAGLTAEQEYRRRQAIGGSSGIIPGRVEKPLTAQEIQFELQPGIFSFRRPRSAGGI